MHNVELKNRKYDFCHFGESLICRKYKFAYSHSQLIVFNVITIEKDNLVGITLILHINMNSDSILFSRKMCSVE